MPPNSMKYFKDHVTNSVFDNQAILATVLDSLDKRILIESKDISPLTVRLFNVKSGLERISDCVTKLAIEPFPQVFLERGYYIGSIGGAELHTEVAPSGSAEYVISYLTPEKDWTQDPCLLDAADMAYYSFEPADNNCIRIINQNSRVHTFFLFSGLYDFFVNLDSVFDRIRLEVNSIYFDGKKELDESKTKGNKYWSRFLNPNNDKVKAMGFKEFNRLVHILTGSLAAKLDETTGKYRNRLIHDGDLEIHIDKLSGKVYIPDDPLSATPTFATELVPLVDQVFSEVQILLRDIYAQMIADINAKKKIPLV
ncbi:MAG: hypothetical protein WBD64_00845 [Candidatus Zixiibacteriota bacterium]